VNWQLPKTEMKISDIEFQGDGSKATFTIPMIWVDFRLLIKDFAKEFKSRDETSWFPSRGRS
jgi:cell fate regulator YaaT (PSP1 superfamily)